MICRHLTDCINVRGSCLVKLVKSQDIAHLKQFTHLKEYACRSLCIIYRTVMACQHHIKMLGQRVQLEVMKSWHKETCNRQCIYYRIVKCHSLLCSLIAYKARIKFRIMCNHNAAFAEFKKLREYLLNLRCSHYH